MNADFKLFYQAGNDLMIIILLFIIVASFHMTGLSASFISRKLCLMLISGTQKWIHNLIFKIAL